MLVPWRVSSKVESFVRFFWGGMNRYELKTKGWGKGRYFQKNQCKDTVS